MKVLERWVYVTVEFDPDDPGQQEREMFDKDWKFVDRPTEFVTVFRKSADE